MSTLYLVSTPIGNLSDLSPRARETLAHVSRVLAEDTRRTKPLLTHLGLRTPLVSFHAHNESAKRAVVLGWLDKGEEIALVSDAGTPLVSDPGEGLVEAVIARGHRVVPIPGPSAILAALVASGLPSARFSFQGFLPRKGSGRQEVLERVAFDSQTTILFESPERLVSSLEALGAVTGPGRRGAVARELTKIHEEFVRGTLEELAVFFSGNPPRGEVTLVVEGAGEDEAGTEVDRAAAAALGEALLAQGKSPSRAAKDVATRLRIPRNLAYQVVLGLGAGEQAEGGTGDGGPEAPKPGDSDSS